MLLGQGENNIWYFHTQFGDGLDFNTSPPTSISNGKAIDNGVEVNTVSDSLGNLLFYTNGGMIWTKTHSIMQNGQNLGTGIFSLISTVMKSPSNNNLYYVFSRPESFGFSGDLYYSMIDMRLNNGLGAVTSVKNVLLGSGFASRIGATTGRCGDTWIVLQLRSTNTFVSYRINDGGISDPIMSVVGLVSSGLGGQRGKIIFSPMGDIVFAGANIRDAQLLLFDGSTGVLSNSIVLPPEARVDARYSSSYSEDGKKLYTAEASSDGVRIYQYDLSIYDGVLINDSKIQIGFITFNFNVSASLRMSPQGVIIISASTQYYSAILQPNLAGTNSQFVEEYLPKDFIGSTIISDLGKPVIIPEEPINIPTSLLPNDTTICESQSILIDLSNLGDTYLWSDGSVDSIRSLSEAGLYAVEIEEEGCIMMDTVAISKRVAQSISLGVDTSICQDASLQLTVPDTFASYRWQDDSNESVLTVNDSGTYWIEIRDNYGCVIRDTIIIMSSSSDLNLGSDTTLCRLDSIILSSNIVSDSYLWNTSQQSSNILIGESGLYWLEIQKEGCSLRDSILVTQSENLLNLGSDTTICIGENLSFSLPNEGSYLWQDGTITSTYTIDTAGLYWVESQNQCMDRDTIMVTELEIDAVILASDLIICDQEPVLLAVDQGDPGVMINWSTGSSDPSIIVEAAGIYKVTISSGGCMATDSIVITSQSDCDCHVYIPNVFDIKSQVGNHLFTISSNCTLSDYKLSIFDRWGGLIYNTQDIARQWDGKMADQRINTGVYPYLVEYRTSVDGQILRERGTVLLID